MPDQEAGGPSHDRSEAPGAKDLIARVQALVDATPAGGGHPLEWAVGAYFLGDMDALAALSLRSRS